MGILATVVRLEPAKWNANSIESSTTVFPLSILNVQRCCSPHLRQAVVMQPLFLIIRGSVQQSIFSLRFYRRSIGTDGKITKAVGWALAHAVIPEPRHTIISVIPTEVHSLLSFRPKQCGALRSGEICLRIESIPTQN